MKRSYKKWLSKNTVTLFGKTVAITGSTGGIGRALCRYLLYLDAALILVDRNSKRSEQLRLVLLGEFPNADIRCITADLEDMASVRSAADLLAREPLDIFIHNAGAYSIPRHRCNTGYDNVFQINFLSPYYVINKLIPTLEKRGGRVVIVGSIAHRYSRTDSDSVDFSDRSQASKVYGNAKRYLMFSTYELSERYPNISFAVTHPGITLTGITAHYPKIIFAIIKHPMKVIFMRPQKASLCVLRGVFESCEKCEWFDIWGYPTKRRLKSADGEEINYIGETAIKLYGEIDKNF